jgi:hypothetical protein
MNAYDLLYAPIGHPKGSLIDYLDKLEASDAAEAAVATAVKISMRLPPPSAGMDGRSSTCRAG